MLEKATLITIGLVSGSTITYIISKKHLKKVAGKENIEYMDGVFERAERSLSTAKKALEDFEANTSKLESALIVEKKTNFKIF